MTHSSRRVAIIHPWFPKYREAFFDELVRRCEAVGIELQIFVGDPSPEWRERRDASTTIGATHLQTRFFSLGRRSLGFKSLRAFRACGPFDLVILEQAIRNLESYMLLLSRRYGDKVAWWGHGRTYTEAKPGYEEKLKFALTRRGRWFFAYTEGGKRAVTDAGFPAENVTVVLNSTDTATLRAELLAISDEQIAAFKKSHGLSGQVVLHLGALDEPKRVPFLLDAAKHAHALDPNFQLAVAGAGSDAELIRKAAGRYAFVRYLGPMFGSDKALALASSDLILNPGRVGLVAVDSLTSGVPISTTSWDRHAPEFEYLEPGRTALVTDDDPRAFARETMALLNDRPRLHKMSEACVDEGRRFSTEEMVSRFLQGIVGALNVSSKSGKPA